MFPSLIRGAARLLPAVALAALAFGAQAQGVWKPDHPVTLVVPYAAGGGTDAQARAVAQDLSKVWGQPVVIENLPGAEATIGTRKVIGAKPDGYTLLVHIHAITLAKHLPSANGFDPLKELVPVSAFSQLAGVFVANPALPGKTLKEALDYCRTAEKPCSFGTTESVARLQAKMLEEEQKIKELIVVNYKGSGQVVTDLVAGNINTSIMGVTSALAHHQSGALKVLATLGAKRSSILPDVPSTAEAGVPSLDTITWYGIFAPKGTPQNIVDGVAAAVGQAVKGEASTRTFQGLGAEALGTTSAEFTNIIRKETARMDDLVKRFPLQ